MEAYVVREVAMVSKSIQSWAKSSNISSLKVGRVELVLAVNYGLISWNHWIWGLLIWRLTINELLLGVKVDNPLTQVGRGLRGKLANQLRINTKVRILGTTSTELESIQRNRCVGIKLRESGSLVGKQGRGQSRKSERLHIINFRKHN